MDVFVKYYSNQLKNIPDNKAYGKLSFFDIKRLEGYIKGDIFDSEKCCNYYGEIPKNSNYMAFSYNCKKLSVLRLLYHNYKGFIDEDDITIRKCDTINCVNLNHFVVQKKS